MGQTGQTGQTGLDFSGNLCGAAFAILPMFFEPFPNFMIKNFLLIRNDLFWQKEIILIQAS